MARGEVAGCRLGRNMAREGRSRLQVAGWAARQRESGMRVRDTLPVIACYVHNLPAGDIIIIIIIIITCPEATRPSVSFHHNHNFTRTLASH